MYTYLLNQHRSLIFIRVHLILRKSNGVQIFIIFSINHYNTWKKGKTQMYKSAHTMILAGTTHGHRCPIQHTRSYKSKTVLCCQANKPSSGHFTKAVWLERNFIIFVLQEALTMNFLCLFSFSLLVRNLDITLASKCDEMEGFRDFFIFTVVHVSFKYHSFDFRFVFVLQCWISIQIISHIALRAVMSILSDI